MLYVVETSTVSFGERVTVTLEAGRADTVAIAERAAALHTIIMGWTTPVARILEAAS